MSSNIIKYLDITSYTRNRNLYPNPAQFEIVVSNNNNNFNVLSALDPVSKQYPIISFVPQDDIDSLNNSIVLDDEIIYTNEKIVLCFPSSQNINKSINYYRGITLSIISTSSTETFIVTGWVYLNSIVKMSQNYDCFQISLDNSTSIDITDSGVSFNFNQQTNYDTGSIHIPLGVATSQTYKNYYLYNDDLNENVIINAYDGTFSTGFFNGPLSSWSNDHQVSLVEQIPYGNGLIVAGSTSKVLKLNLNIIQYTSNIVGSFIRIIDSSSQNHNLVRRIINYDLNENSVIVDINFKENVLEDSKFQLLSFTKDNYNTITYNGSHIQQESCYDVQLLSLIIPNINLQKGGITLSYPYLYVALYNISTSNSISSNIIYSNNPNCNKCVFKIPITDLSPQYLNSFLTLDKSQMSQTIKINPSRSYFFSIYLPDGSLYKMDFDDTMSPNLPNRLLQISATFSLKRRK